ncbi:hypothetical protein [Paracoccus sp. IB05]|uniref:hypothetical protein n=1 Tax=Paracoccus sp. IB05 TaxID=2779367 RepID=UPI0018E7CBC4|nr:hypothetical protein [Paracoccus sp. IB05]MBJ2152661.1 hypothetical protein [Paracoccus sp. IB05]
MTTPPLRKYFNDDRFRQAIDGLISMLSGRQSIEAESSEQYLEFNDALVAAAHVRRDFIRRMSELWDIAFKSIPKDRAYIEWQHMTPVIIWDEKMFWKAVTADSGKHQFEFTVDIVDNIITLRVDKYDVAGGKYIPVDTIQKGGNVVREKDHEGCYVLFASTEVNINYETLDADKMKKIKQVGDEMVKLTID